jgi:uncharacterized protein YodC (DUF2158 family)
MDGQLNVCDVEIGEKLKVGDVVTLKSGGKEMTIVSISEEDDTACVAMFLRNGGLMLGGFGAGGDELHKDKLPLVCLKRVGGVCHEKA